MAFGAISRKTLELDQVDMHGSFLAPLSLKKKTRIFRGVSITPYMLEQKRAALRRSYRDLAEVQSYNPPPFAPQETLVILHPGITASEALTAISYSGMRRSLRKAGSASVCANSYKGELSPENNAAVKDECYEWHFVGKYHCVRKA
ncbi:hypothetical protein DBV15_07836 [Temnothorax longispinosus]|uniref:Uncharacterized protein n=1 Tax=Temnothorax longispinosus TaxID=300112 RepID=A0A4S2JZM1_9HYME|nr:hypothetical protein DBV15_07836 [Temnothorax longispinosus]